ncbi:MAG TPA: hypothetical protein DDW22_01240 [Prevotellaceae bacterium]|nr:hypothetical protein [Prevotellaceae bacterium]
MRRSAMIPRKIHFIWIGGEAVTSEAATFVLWWRRLMPDCQLVVWDKARYEAIPGKPRYALDAYAQRKWAFVCDWLRAYVLYKEGGWYFDSDVQLFRSADYLSCHRFVSAVEFDRTQYEHHRQTGEGRLGMQMQAAFLGSEAGHPFLRDVLDFYQEARFEFVGHESLISPVIYATLAERYGFRYENARQDLREGMHLEPSEVVLPYAGWANLASSAPLALHHCAHSWVDRPWGTNMRLAGMLARKFGVE